TRVPDPTLFRSRPPVDPFLGDDPGAIDRERRRQQREARRRARSEGRKSLGERVSGALDGAAEKGREALEQTKGGARNREPPPNAPEPPALRRPRAAPAANASEPAEAQAPAPAEPAEPAAPVEPGAAAAPSDTGRRHAAQSMQL